jgi:hypothetical protein
VRYKDTPQRITAPAVRLYKRNIVLGGLAFCGFCHLMRNRICKKNNQFGISNALGKTPFALCENFCFVVVFLTDVFILTDHAVKAANNHYTHSDASYSNSN